MNPGVADIPQQTETHFRPSSITEYAQEVKNAYEHAARIQKENLGAAYYFHDMNVCPICACETVKFRLLVIDLIIPWEEK